MRWTFHVRRVEFEMRDGTASQHLERLDSIATAEYNDAHAKSRPWIIVADDEPSRGTRAGTSGPSRQIWWAPIPEHLGPAWVSGVFTGVIRFKQE